VEIDGITGQVFIEDPRARARLMLLLGGSVLVGLLMIWVLISLLL
jgi:hypothetical protein